jgi:hypothetical protein
MKANRSLPARSFGPASLLFATCAVSVALLPGVSAASFSFDGSLRSSDNTAPPNPPLIVVPIPGLGDVPFYAWKQVDNGQGTVSAHAGFGSLGGVPAADLTFEFGDLELLQLDFGANTATETYGEADAGARFFNLYLQGNKIATGMDFSLSIVTDTDRNSPNFTLATGTGSVTLQSVGGHGFVDDLTAIQGSPVLNLSISSFTSPVFVANPIPGVDRAPQYFNDYTIAGAGTAVPEPEAYAALAAAGLVGWATWRRVKSAR